jgi:hypothetical protein
MSDPSASNFGDWLLDAGLTEPKIQDQGDGWSSWVAQSFQDGLHVTRTYLYVAPSCAWIDIERAANSLGRRTANPGYVVVFPTRTAPQLEPRNEARLKTLFPAGNVVTLQKLYYASALNRNLRTTDLLPVEHFVEQKATFPGLEEPV